MKLTANKLTQLLLIQSVLTVNKDHCIKAIFIFSRIIYPSYSPLHTHPIRHTNINHCVWMLQKDAISRQKYQNNSRQGAIALSHTSLQWGTATPHTSHPIGACGFWTPVPSPWRLTVSIPLFYARRGHWSRKYFMTSCSKMQIRRRNKLVLRVLWSPKESILGAERPTEWPKTRIKANNGRQSQDNMPRPHVLKVITVA